MRKGQIGLIILVIAVMPMIIFMTLAGYFLMDLNLEANLNAEMAGQQDQFWTTMNSFELLEYKDLGDRMGVYPYNRPPVLDLVDDPVSSGSSGYSPSDNTLEDGEQAMFSLTDNGEWDQVIIKVSIEEEINQQDSFYVMTGDGNVRSTPWIGIHEGRISSKSSSSDVISDFGSAVSGDYRFTIKNQDSYEFEAEQVDGPRYWEMDYTGSLENIYLVSSDLNVEVEQVRMLTSGDQDPSVRDRIKQDLDEFMSQQDIRYYEVVVEYPDGTQLEIEGDGTGPETYSRQKTYNLATPFPENAEVTFKVARW